MQQPVDAIFRGTEDPEQGRMTKMNGDDKKNKQNVIEFGKETRSMRSVFIKVIAVSLIPLIIMGVAITIITNISFRGILEGEIQKELRTAAYGLSENYSFIDSGDYVMKDDGTIFKGSHQVNGRLGNIGNELLKNGLVCTFFYGDTRIDTTVVDLDGNNMAGTKLDPELYKRLYESGEEQFCESADLGGRIYYGYYIPYRNSDGEVTTIFFAGRLQSEVFENVKSVSSMIFWIGITVLIFGIIVSLLCTIYMVGFLFKHFKDKEDLNIKRAAAKEQTGFMTLVSREIRDPVDTITVLSDRMLEEETSPHIREHVLGIKEASNSMMISLKSIYDYAILETGETSLNEDEYELTDLVKDCCKRVAPGLERKKLEFKLNYDESMPDYLYGDYAKIRQILDNLLENAVKYTYSGGITLDISYRKITSEKIDITFAITDTGAGIRKEDAEKLFYTIGKVGENKNISIKGTGLGLLICKRLVNVLDGRISAESEIGKGSVFKFTVPQDVIKGKTVGESMNNGI